MNQENAQSGRQPGNGPANKSMKIQIWIMLLMVGGVMLAGTLMVPDTEEERLRMIELLGTTNQGTLVKPDVVITSALEQAQATSLKWKILIAGGESCDEACQKVILETRQIHILLGKLTRRAERVYLANPEQLDDQELADLTLAHPFLTIQQTGLEKFGELMATSSMEWDMADTRYFVVTPDNEAILYYTQDDDVTGLLEDLKHLLKYSPERN